MSPAEMKKVTTILLRHRRPLWSPFPPLPSLRATWRKKKRSCEKVNELHPRTENKQMDKGSGEAEREREKRMRLNEVA